MTTTIHHDRPTPPRHHHHAIRDEDRGYVCTVNIYDENRAAHGNIMRIEYCACGAERRTNINYGQIERGAWRTS